MARKKKHEEEHHEEHADETWLIPYADLLTLLLALFIVLFASSTVDKAKVEQMGAAFADAFSSSYYSPMTGTLGTFFDDAKGAILDDSIGLGTDARGTSIDIANVDLFENDGFEIKPSAIPVLTRIAEMLNSNKYKRFRVIVEGHTDDIQVVNNYGSNRGVSSIRAAVVADALAKMGVAEDRVTAVGMAGIAPMLPNFNVHGEPVPDNRKRNRRVVIRIEV